MIDVSTCNIFTYKVKSFGSNTTPGSLNSTRSLVFSKKESLVASGNRLVYLNVDLPTHYTKIDSKIKGIPTPFRIPDQVVTEKLVETGLPYEIQSINQDNNSTLVSASDSKGNVWVGTRNDQSVQFQYKLDSNPLNNTYIELGWSGTTFDPKATETLAKTHFYQKQVQIYQNQQLINTIQLVQNPTQIKYFQSPNGASTLLAVTELNQLKIFDLRLASNECVIQKLTPQQSSQWIYTLGISEDNNYIAVGGANRSVTVFDTRKWSNSGSWKNCLKYEVTNIHFSTTKPSVCYVGGLDSEVLAGEWNGSGGVDHFTGLRVDSRWIGISKLQHQEFLFGFTSSTSAYWIENAEKLHQPKITHPLTPGPDSPNPTPHKKIKAMVSDDNNNMMDQ
ncbi:hypothetical protein DLAC_10401 [Tieghemostelium lacteum]|uniref:WD40 repeat-containing protein n=1 Tax=Tieghemostelium lacteum TaxID=361077 RepID=A0A151Z5G9_TIELA|nr:hypothetical protein DLAC_10401 [Tieghemostelium lacteum]|eukprot:KYQ89157.1 hypothetical protein DLAC_10401 [Tieghemostelium lacteum]